MRHLSTVEVMRIDERLDAIAEVLSEFDAGMAINSSTYDRGMSAVHSIRAIVGLRSTNGRLRRGIINLEAEKKKKSQAAFEKMKATSKRKNVARYKPQRTTTTYYTTGPT